MDILKKESKKIFELIETVIKEGRERAVSTFVN